MEGSQVDAKPPHTVSARSALLLEDERGAVGRARRWIADRLEDAGLDDLVDEARLIVSELVTNALLHAGPSAELIVRIAPATVRLEVRDGSSLPLRPHHGSEGMTGRGLHLIESLAHSWGVERVPAGKVVWAELQAGRRMRESERDEDELLAMWATGPAGPEAPATGDALFTVRLGHVPTDLLLSAKSHVDNLVREFTLAAAGARTGASAAVPPHLAELIETVVNRFAEPRQTIKRQALAAARAGLDHVHLELELPLTAADAGEDYLRALDEADAYCRAVRLLTLESPPQHRVFRRWYVGELIGQLRHAAAGSPPAPGQTFEQHLLREIDTIAAAERASERAVRLHSITAALAGAATPRKVAAAVLTEGVAALRASGGGLLLAEGSPTMSVPGTVGYDQAVVARLRTESRDAELPAAVALRTGEPVWLESRQERDQRFPELVGLEPGTVSMCAVPLEVGGRRLGALRFSFAEGRLFDDGERSFVLTMAGQTAQALDRAVLYHQRLDAARRLQRTLLPPQIPAVPGVQITAAYHPLADGMDVGGDFYDVWECGPDCWAIAIGDVCGSGPEAAAVTGLVRHTLHALTMEEIDVVTVIERLNRTLVDTASGTDGEQFCTALLGFLRSSPSQCRLELASGGHPGPLVFQGDGRVEEIELTGSLLGVLSLPSVDSRTVHLQPGAEVVLFTDGVIESRNGAAFFGIDGVVSAVNEARAAGTSTAEAIRQAVLLHGGGKMRDDLAVLALRRGGRGA